jgi:glycosyltransferase involved in cell wall biosynthesis
MITVLIPTYNRPNQLKIALKSLNNQSYKELKIIISDNSSNNESSQIVEKFKDLNIYYIKNKKNIGNKQNFLNCLSHVQTNHFVWLMDDDYFVDTDFFLKASNVIKEKPNIGLIYSGRQLFNQSTKKIYKKTYTQKRYFNSASEWVIKRNKRLVFNFSGVILKSDDFFSEIINNEVGAGWAVDDLGFIFAAQYGVQELRGINISLSTHVADHNGRDAQLEDYLISIRANREKIINILDQEQQNKNNYSKKAINYIKKTYSDWSLITAEGVKILKSDKKNKNKYFFQQIKSNFIDFEGIFYYLHKMIIVVILNMFK